MPFKPDLDLYFERIGYGGPTAPGREALDAIVRAHVQSIPFENLDILLGRSILLEPASLQHKLLVERRGGYCFEQNTFLMLVLCALGYEVTPLSARVRIGRGRAEVPPRTHLLLRVELGGASWLVDVGVGGLSPTAALRLELDEIQQTPHEPRRLVSEGCWQGLDVRAPDARLFHQAWLEESWQDVYELTLEPMPDIDRQLANYYTSTHPGSHFRSAVTVARATPDGRKALLNRRFTFRPVDGFRQERFLETPEELLATLQDEFGIHLPAGSRLTCAGLDWPSTGL